MAVHKKYPALGRGLDALISTEEEVHTSGSSSINEIPVDKIRANPAQPRRDFDPETLRELADSIRELGIVQPITLRQMDDGTYQIIAGERRWRASSLAGLATIPAYIRTADDFYADALQACPLHPGALDNAAGRYVEDDIYDVDPHLAETFDRSFPIRRRTTGNASQQRFNELCAMRRHHHDPRPGDGSGH